jgi:ABC-type polysaccharide/polyol phosphate transport system ATPase subunit
VARITDERPPAAEDQAPEEDQTPLSPGDLAVQDRGDKTARKRSLPVGRSSSQKVIKFSNVSKRFILHHERPRSFQEMVVSLFGLRTPTRRGIAMPEPANEEFWALRDVNFGIYAGEAVGIIGENGSGKSTTLKLISRILEPTSGGVSVKGKVSALLELGTGFHPELTGRENIFLNGSLLGIPRKEMQTRYESIVDFAELHEFIDTPIKHYSSGMVMRLGFAVAINVDPEILLTDEVLAVGDEAFQRKCLEQIAILRKRGVTIVYVSHALDSVRALCKRAIWLDHGRLVADGPAGEVIDKYLTYENERHAERLRSEHPLWHSDSAVAQPEPLQAPSADSDQAAEDEDRYADEDQAEGEASMSLDQPGSRWTTGDVQITGVRFVDGAGIETSLFQTGEPLTIRIMYKASKRLEGPVFGLALYTQNGTHLNGPNTRFAGLEIPYVEGSGYVDYEVAELPLLAGTYDVTVAVTGPDLTDLLDHQHRAYSFSVQPTPGLPERWGLLNIPATWSFHPEGEVRS